MILDYKKWSNIQYVFTDIDDTLTYNGVLPSETLIALEKLQQNNIYIVAVTGASAGWCDQIVQLWPIDVVIGENGAFVMQKKNNQVIFDSHLTINEMYSQQKILKDQILNIISSYSNINLARDQFYRICDVAIDIAQSKPRISKNIILKLFHEIKKKNINVSVSSIHMNTWYGQHSKLKTTLEFLEKQDLMLSNMQDKVCYIGDSLNDQEMFCAFNNSVGVSNITPYLADFQKPPIIITDNPGGYGFSEFVTHLLTLKENK